MDFGIEKRTLMSH